MKIYTKTATRRHGLFGGGRVPKSHPRVGVWRRRRVNAVSVVRAAEQMPRIDEVLVPIQRDLPNWHAARHARPRQMQQHSRRRVSMKRARHLERAIDAGDAELEPLRSFIVPGGSQKAAALHVARTVCRRAERRVVELGADTEIPPLVVIYLNRLSDLLFTLARVANKRSGTGEVTW
jgi:cob(I)alamin adenosyltransferase